MSDSQTSHLNGIVDLIIARNVNAIEATLQHPAYGWAFTHLVSHHNKHVLRKQTP